VGKHGRKKQANYPVTIFGQTELKPLTEATAWGKKWGCFRQGIKNQTGIGALETGKGAIFNTINAR